MKDARGGFLEQIRQSGVPLSPPLAAAFARVRREAFVPDGFQRRDGSRVTPADPDFLATVYRDDVLVTKMDGAVPVSSSSQPSLMALMIEALRVRPGLRVLEVGAGTGYNAALLDTLGAVVTSIDVQEDVADRARSALARAGHPGVRVEARDGYLGVPGERFDRVIVTVGVAGVSPHWLAQLEPDGHVIAPVDHAGNQPVLAVRGAPDGPVTATVVCQSGFMTASGPLTADHPGAFPAPLVDSVLEGLEPHFPARFDPPLTGVPYGDLSYAAGVWNRRATRVGVRRREHGGLALLDETRTGGAVIPPDGSVLAAGPRAADYAAAAADVLDRWLDAGRPPAGAWRVGLGRSGDPQSPIWVPETWQLAGQPAT
jgi:protein-L-isoaspartate(D-aspartate) O-methyltransferase